MPVGCCLQVAVDNDLSNTDSAEDISQGVCPASLECMEEVEVGRVIILLTQTIFIILYFKIISLFGW